MTKGKEAKGSSDQSRFLSALAEPPLAVVADHYRDIEVQKRRNLDLTWAGGTRSMTGGQHADARQHRIAAVFGDQHQLRFPRAMRALHTRAPATW